MEQVKKFLDEQLNKVDIERQRQIIENQSYQVQEQSDRILKLLSEGPELVSTGQIVSKWTTRQC